MPPCRRSRALVLTFVDGIITLRLKGAGLAGVGQVAPARLLPGLCRPPRQGSCWRNPPCPFALYASGLSAASAALYLPFLYPAKPGRRRGYDCPCTSKGVQKRPLLLYTKNYVIPEPRRHHNRHLRRPLRRPDAFPDSEDPWSRRPLHHRSRLPRRPSPEFHHHRCKLSLSPHRPICFERHRLDLRVPIR